MIATKEKIRNVLLCSFLFIYACNTNPKTIIPGKGVNGIELGEKLNKNFELNGITIEVNPKDSTIIHIDITNQSFYTKNNLKVGSAANEVKNIMGKPNDVPLLEKSSKIEQFKTRLKSLRYDHITFFLDTETQKVNKIRIW